MRMGIERHLIC